MCAQVSWQTAIIEVVAGWLPIRQRQCAQARLDYHTVVAWLQLRMRYQVLPKLHRRRHSRVMHCRHFVRDEETRRLGCKVQVARPRSGNCSQSKCLRFEKRYSESFSPVERDKCVGTKQQPIDLIPCHGLVDQTNSKIQFNLGQELIEFR